MKQSIASASPRTWNRKNLPSDIERYGGSGKTLKVIRQIPSAATLLVRRRPVIVIASVAVVMGLALGFWIFAERD